MESSQIQLTKDVICRRCSNFETGKVVVHIQGKQCNGEETKISKWTLCPHCGGKLDNASIS